jgi:hypothetical protein
MAGLNPSRGAIMNEYGCWTTGNGSWSYGYASRDAFGTAYDSQGRRVERCEW